MSKNYSAIKKIIVTLRFFSENKFSSIGPIYYEYGSMVITFDSSSTAVVAYEILKHRVFEDKKLLGKNWRHISEETSTLKVKNLLFTGLL